jgi:hypothetical protein
MSWRGLGIALAVALLVAGGAEASVQVRARAEPDTTLLGSPVRYVLEVVVDAGVEVVMAQPAERLGPFEIVDFGDEPPRTEDGKQVIGRWFTLRGFEVGHQLVSSPPVSFRAPGEPLTEVTPIETRISIESLVDRATGVKDLRDIKAPRPVPRDWRPWIVVAAGLALLAALGALVVWWRRRRRTVAVAPPVPADVRARRALAQLAARGLLERGAFKEYYAALSAIVRGYLEDRFGLRAPEMTTEEFLLATTRNAELTRPQRASLGEFLRESDLVKFARHVPALVDAERAFTAAGRFVDETALRPEVAA